MKQDALRQLMELLQRLSDAKIAHRLDQSRDDAIMIKVSVPGERWEIEFVDYDDEFQIEIERFRSNGKIYDDGILEMLFLDHSADSPARTPEQVHEESEAFFRS